MGQRDSNIPAQLSPRVETALHRCGRERVHHRQGTHDAGIAIRWDPEPGNITSPDAAKFLVRDAPTADEAGALAAQAFADRIRETAGRLNDWASRIEAALKEQR